MMDKVTLKIQFEANFGLILKNLEGISTEEALIFPQNEANCVNWILGHLICSRNLILNALGEKSVWDNERFYCYGRYVNALAVQQEFINFELLKQYFGQTQLVLSNGLDNLQTDAIEVVKKISFLSLHESYHCGQLGYARRLLCKEGVIK